MSEDKLTGHGALVLRLALGIMFIALALLKVLVFTIPGTIGFFESVGLPGFTAYLVIAAELAGGTALILGVYVRLVSLALVPVLLGAAWVHLPNGWVFSAEGGGWEYPVFLTVAVLVQALIGAGSMAVNQPFGQLPGTALGKLSAS
jgi:putative oxidoreductase